MNEFIGSLARFGFRLLWGRVTGRNYPFLIQLNVTNRCNYRCAYCYGTYFDRASDEMSLEQIRTVIDRMADRGLFRLNLVGGEPLLREDLGAIIAHARSRGVLCAMTTNGKLVPRRIADLVGLSTVCFSLDGREENNDRNRVKGSHKAVMEGMAACRERGLPVQLSAVLTGRTVSDVDYLVDVASENNCLVGFSTLISQDREDHSTLHSLHPDRESLKGALDRIARLKREGAPILFSERVYTYARDWPLATDIVMGRQPPFESIACLAGRYFGLVDYNGDVYPCPQLMGIVKPGNIFRDGFDKAFIRASNHGCSACPVPCSNDFSLFFGLTPATVFDKASSRLKR